MHLCMSASHKPLYEPSDTERYACSALYSEKTVSSASVTEGDIKTKQTRLHATVLSLIEALVNYGSNGVFLAVCV